MYGTVKKTSNLYMSRYLAPEMPLMSSVIADCPDLASPISWTSLHAPVTTTEGLRSWFDRIDGANRMGRPQREWLDDITECSKASLQELSRAAMDRKRWKILVKMASDTYVR